MEVSSKEATVTDTTKRFELPSKILNYIHFSRDKSSVDQIFTDRSGQPYTFSCRKRRKGRYPKPALTRGWLDFVRSKGIGVGDRVTFRKLDGGELGIEVKKKTEIKVFGKHLSVWVYHLFNFKFQKFLCKIAYFFFFYVTLKPGLGFCFSLIVRI
ncbi:hypothetical protein Pint_18156 [Pistacia integerrima]|uniref:Uncharacterized protein n=1 Tax=Pistacia integerrima TaxID=434235 RepID=A0ACC0YVY1_9ROSI|nr:hypothetical protein Pint_18156 [Pistacia integerrima]